MGGARPNQVQGAYISFKTGGAAPAFLIAESPAHFSVLHFSVKDQANRKMSDGKMSKNIVHGVVIARGKVKW
jgi:hypothetical protein